jgi:aliphatic nitrilase
MLEPGPQAEKFLRDPDGCGGSVIVAPNSRIIAGPMGAEEGILYADCDLELGVLTKLRHDFAGHYNRPDVFQLHVNRATPRLYTVHGQDGILPAPEATALPEPTGGLLASPAADDVRPSTNGQRRDEH